ncbi:MAG: hypothetical protein UX78_C0002G0068 [Candidatus Amesbacteria bacterium GW2011_GWA2_47_11]|uniref:Uncharacterized protein n=1 Tax=Candidatus Amesbacteria bacterium GW2011_GWA2_47_11 TaxID=1618357 RepID=A0A0G1TRU9_9BACT|nr:MAG: hypothetical protein UX78_C0002G0068 [Candidatus Amesbacteria bacterium GW2011_GWA2_47_11]
MAGSFYLLSRVLANQIDFTGTLSYNYFVDLRELVRAAEAFKAKKEGLLLVSGVSEELAQAVAAVEAAKLLIPARLRKKGITIHPNVAIFVMRVFGAEED